MGIGFKNDFELAEYQLQFGGAVELRNAFSTDHVSHPLEFGFEQGWARARDYYVGQDVPVEANAEGRTSSKVDSGLRLEAIRLALVSGDGIASNVLVHAKQYYDFLVSE